MLRGSHVAFGNTQYVVVANAGPLVVLQCGQTLMVVKECFTRLVSPVLRDCKPEAVGLAHLLRVMLSKPLFFNRATFQIALERYVALAMNEEKGKQLLYTIETLTLREELEPHVRAALD